jgi:hypothetical protein
MIRRRRIPGEIARFVFLAGQDEKDDTLVGLIFLVIVFSSNADIGRNLWNGFQNAFYC